MVNEIKAAGLGSSRWTVLDHDTNTENMVSILHKETRLLGIIMHDDEDGNIHREEAKPGEPCNLLKLANTGHEEHQGGSHQHEVVCADGMI